MRETVAKILKVVGVTWRPQETEEKINIPGYYDLDDVNIEKVLNSLNGKHDHIIPDFSEEETVQNNQEQEMHNNIRVNLAV